MSYLGSTLPIGTVPTGIFSQPLRDKTGRLTDWGVQLMTAAQNVAIQKAEQLAKRKLGMDEKLFIIAKVQREFGLNNKAADRQWPVGLQQFAGFLSTYYKELALRTTAKLPETLKQTGKNVGTALSVPINAAIAGAAEVVREAAKQIEKETGNTNFNLLGAGGLAIGAIALFLLLRSR